MSSPELIRRGANHRREFFLLEVDSPSELSSFISVPSSQFSCVIAWDASLASVDDISLVAKSLLRSGATYVCAWGPGCERVHDVFGEEIVQEEISTAVGPVVMTTWHDDETLSETVEFLVQAVEPQPDGTSVILAVAIGSSDFAAMLRKELISKQ